MSAKTHGWYVGILLWGGGGWGGSSEILQNETGMTLLRNEACKSLLMMSCREDSYNSFSNDNPNAVRHVQVLWKATHM